MINIKITIKILFLALSNILYRYIIECTLYILNNKYYSVAIKKKKNVRTILNFLTENYKVY